MTTAGTTMAIAIPTNGTGLVDTAPEVLKPRIPADDPIAVAEEAIRTMTLEHANEEMALVMNLLQNGGPAAAPRALHLIEGLSQIHAQVLQLLGIHGRKKRPHRAGAISIGNQYTMGSIGALSADYDYEDDPETYTGNAQAETFGNKALKQLIEMFKPIMQEGGLLGMAHKVKNGNPALEIESLTRALADAKTAKLGKDVVKSIEAKLKIALAVGTEAPATIEAKSPEEAGA